MEIPSDEESGRELKIEEQTAGIALEAESVAANGDATSMEGKAREVGEEQELEEGEQEVEEKEQEEMETSVHMQGELEMASARPLSQLLTTPILQM